MQRLILGIILIGLLWAIGLAAFIADLPPPTRNTPAKTEAVVVYTGGGGARISAGMAVFAQGGGERLLISGVHRDTSRERLSELWSGSATLFECCVDLGREAHSTQGNALEAANWAIENEFNHVLLVTSEYHMPRAIAETRAKLPGATIMPYAVASGYLDDKGRPISRLAWKKLAGEYTKFLLARVTSFFSAMKF